MEFFDGLYRCGNFRRDYWQTCHGPAGFDVHYTIKSGADVSAGANSVDAQLNDKSLADARARNEGGSNKQLAALIPHKPTAGSALSAMEDKRAQGDKKYQAMFTKRGLEAAVDVACHPDRSIPITAMCCRRRLRCQKVR